MNKSTRILATLAVMLPVVACAPTETTESTGEFFDDAVITIKVKNEIFKDTRLNLLQIHVITFKGRVQMSGFVDSPQMVALAAIVAGQVEGVRSVQNDLIAK